MSVTSRPVGASQEVSRVTKVFVDGAFVPRDEAKVSVFDHGFLYGDGVFEGIRAYDGVIFKLDQHLERLYKSAKTIMLEIPYSVDEMREIVRKACAENNLRDAYIRLVVSRGKGDLGLDPRKCQRATVVVIADTISLYPPELYEKGMSIGTGSIRRSRAEILNPQIKSLNYLNNIMAKMEANQRNLGEVVMLSEEGFVAECSADNIFMVQRGRLITPAPHLGILLGITRETVLELAHEAGYPVLETTFTRHELWNADEVFLTGSAAEIVPVVKVDERVVGNGKPGPVTQDLWRRFRAYAPTNGVRI